MNEQTTDTHIFFHTYTHEFCNCTGKPPRMLKNGTLAQQIPTSTRLYHLAGLAISVLVLTRDLDLVGVFGLYPEWAQSILSYNATTLLISAYMMTVNSLLKTLFRMATMAFPRYVYRVQVVLMILRVLASNLCLLAFTKSRAAKYVIGPEHISAVICFGYSSVFSLWWAAKIIWRLHLLSATFRQPRLSNNTTSSHTMRPIWNVIYFLILASVVSWVACIVMIQRIVTFFATDVDDVPPNEEEWGIGPFVFPVLQVCGNTIMLFASWSPLRSLWSCSPSPNAIHPHPVVPVARTQSKTHMQVAQVSHGTIRPMENKKGNSMDVSQTAAIRASQRRSNPGESFSPNEGPHNVNGSQRRSNLGESISPNEGPHIVNGSQRRSNLDVSKRSSNL